ncbi:MFS transporter [Dictyobacter formicarum]|uniref:Tetracycline efflux MFS transporter TetA(P) n=1 Tax=Dictyobacter formicarum TaxID=2778368 RepID=A0ABQ3VKF7_9CHLR|nr:MFS transporter [Dictyobacter formicarum]GHO85833.1 tetracycline efflux MFS transporter TetA(P) [Dictyobacter formicarum]
MGKSRAATVYFILTAVTSLSYSMIFAIDLPYQIETVGLNPLQLTLVATVLQAVTFCCQAPTGVLADMYSRRWAVVAGCLLVGVNFLVEGLFPSFLAILIAQILRGIGATMMNGADSAWIADELGEERVSQVYMRAAQVGSIASLLGIVLSTALAQISLNLPVVLGGGIFAGLSIFLALFMTEHHFTPAPRGKRSSWQHLGYTLRTSLQLVRSRPILLTILGIGAFYGIFSVGFDRLWPYHLLHHFTFPALPGGLKAVAWFGIIEAGIVVTNLCGTEIVRRSINTNRPRAVAWTMFAIDGLTIAGIIAFALAGQFALALTAFWLITTVLGPRMPLERIWLNQHLASNVRATVFSLRGQVDALGQIIGGPILGAIATATTSSNALISASLILVPALFLYLLSLRAPTQQANATMNNQQYIRSP